MRQKLRLSAAISVGMLSVGCLGGATTTPTPTSTPSDSATTAAASTQITAALKSIGQGVSLGASIGSSSSSNTGGVTAGMGTALVPMRLTHEGLPSELAATTPTMSSEGWWSNTDTFYLTTTPVVGQEYTIAWKYKSTTVDGVMVSSPSDSTVDRIDWQGTTTGSGSTVTSTRITTNKVAYRAGILTCAPAASIAIGGTDTMTLSSGFKIVITYDVKESGKSEAGACIISIGGTATLSAEDGRYTASLIVTGLTQQMLDFSGDILEKGAKIGTIAYASMTKTTTLKDTAGAAITP